MTPPFPSRAAEHNRLRRLLSLPTSAPIFIHGPPSTGKHTTLISALPPSTTVVALDGALVHSDAALFRPLSAADAPSVVDAPSAVAAINFRSTHTTLLLERADRLPSALRPDALRALLRLHTLVCNPDLLHIVLISRLPWPALRDTFGLDDVLPQTLLFPAYTECEAADAVVAMTTPSLPTDGTTAEGENTEGGVIATLAARDGGPALVRRLHAEFATRTVQILFSTSTDIAELARVCKEMYPSYLAPLVTDPSTPPAHLWPRVDAALRGAARRLHSRELVLGGGRSGEGAEEEEEESLFYDNNERGAGSAEKDLRAMGLCAVARALLLSVFLAANNPAKMDIHYFSATVVNKRGKRSVRKTAPSSSASAAARRHRRAPAVPLNRVMSIFDAIQNAGNDVYQGADARARASELSSAAFVQLGNLVSVALLHREAGGDITEPKFRTSVSLEMAQALAASITVELSAYLHEDSFAA